MAGPAKADDLWHAVGQTLSDKACPGQPRSFQPDMEKKFPETTHPSGCGDGYKSVPVSIISDNMFCNSFLIDIYGFFKKKFCAFENIRDWL